MVEPAYFVIRNLCVLTAFVLLIRNIHWGFLLARMYCNGPPIRNEWMSPLTFPQWIVRTGTFLTALLALSLLLPATLEHVMSWFRPVPGLPFAFLTVLSLETLLVWRWQFFTKDRAAAYKSLTVLAGLALLIEIWGGV